MSAFEAFRRDPWNRQAFGQWYREAYPELFRSALRMTSGSDALAEDLCHDVILSFFKRRAVKSIKSPADALKYLRKAVANRHIDYLKKTYREKPLDELPERAEESLGPESATAAHQLYVDLLRRLDEDDQELLGLMLMGESLPGIARALRISYSSAGVRSHRIRRKIKWLRHFGDTDVKKVRLARLKGIGATEE